MDIILHTFKCCLSRTKVNPQEEIEENLTEHEIELVNRKKKEPKLGKHQIYSR